MMQSLYFRLLDFFELWGQIPGGFWRILWPLTLMTVSSYPLVLCWPILRKNVTSRLDRWVLAFFVGMGYYTLLFSLLNAVIQVPIGEASFYWVVILTSLIGYGWIYREQIPWQGEWRRRHVIVLMGLLLVIFLAGAVRFPNTVHIPDRLLDSDPYRHHPRAEWIVQTGDIATWEPWLVGESPIFELQGCYVLAALLGTVGHVDSWEVWKYGSILMGVFSIVSLYLLAAYLIPGKPRRLAGLFAALLLLGITIHINRTNMGFSVAWALPYLPVALLMLVWTFRFNSFQAGILFGIFFLLVGLSNMVPISTSVVFLFVYCAYEFLKRIWRFTKWLPDESERKKRVTALVIPFAGLLSGTALFTGYLFVWQSTYAGASMPVITKAHAAENRAIMRKTFAIQETRKKLQAETDTDLSSIHRVLGNTIGWHNSVILDRYLGYGKFALGGLAIAFLMFMPAKRESPRFRAWRSVGGYSPEPWIDTKVFLLVFFCVPVLQFLLLPYFMRPSTLTNEDVLDIHRVLVKIKSEDRYKSAILERMLPQGRKEIINYDLSTPVSKELSTTVVQSLNQLILRNALFNKDGNIAANPENLRNKTRKLMEQFKKGNDLSYINRLLIEDFFPNSIKRKDLFGIFRVPTFTGRTYRYLVLPAYCISLAMGFALSILLVLLKNSIVPVNEQRRRWQHHVPHMGATVVVFALLFVQAAYSKGYGRWPPTTTPNEENAFRWMSKTLPEGSKIFAYWFQADFIRSYTAHAGNPMSSIFTGSGRRTGLRINMLLPIEIDGVKIPDMRSISQVIQYSRDNPANYYVFKGRHGPGLPLGKDKKNFTLIAKFKDEKHGVEIYELNSNKLLLNTKLRNIGNPKPRTPE
jgi:hypothetical protein